MFKKTILENGLRIITIPKKETEAVTVLVLVGTGSKYETKEVSGISHFLEHLFFKGTKKRPSTRIITETLDRVGGIYNAFTSEEYTGYFIKVGASHFDLALDLVSDIFFHSKLDQNEIEKEKKVIFEEINMHFNDPMSYVQILWSKVLYGDQPAGREITGTKESVAGIVRRQLAEYMRNQYVASNTVICIAGRINEKEAIKKIRKYFSKIITTLPEKKSKVLERQSAPRCLLHKRETNQTNFCLGVRGYNIFHPQIYAQQLLGIILGGMMSSRLFIEVRDKLGLAYYINTSASIDPDTGFLVTQAGVDSDKIERAISVILNEYKKISQQKVPLKELQRAKDNVKGKTALMFESSDVLASFYGMQEIYKKEILTPKQIYAKINEVTGNSVLKAARDIFRPEKLNLAIIGPFKDKTKFQNLLKFFKL